MAKQTGKFYVLEGIDGAGAATQLRMLCNKLEDMGQACERLSYPDPGGPIGRLIYEYLDKKHDFPVETQFMLYSGDMLKDSVKIRSWLNAGKIVVSSRYITSTLAWQSAQGFPLEKAMRIVSSLDIPKPDAIIYLKISHQTSVHRKFRDKGALDRNESNEKLLETVNKKYVYLSRKKALGKWITIDGEQSKEAVLQEIVSKLKL